MDNLTYDKSRVLNFSIAMTLLVLEIGIPSAEAIRSNSAWTLLGNRIPSFIGLVVSFFVTALYWVAHLKTMKYVSTVDSKLLWLNILLLFFIVLLPFSTGFYVSGSIETGNFAFYCFNLSAIGFFNYLLLRYVVKKLLAKWHKALAMNAFLIWVLAGILAFFIPFLSRIIFILIFVFQPIINNHYRKKIKKAEEVVEE